MIDGVHKWHIYYTAMFYLTDCLICAAHAQVAFPSVNFHISKDVSFVYYKQAIISPRSPQLYLHVSRIVQSNHLLQTPRGAISIISMLCILCLKMPQRNYIVMLLYTILYTLYTYTHYIQYYYTQCQNILYLSNFQFYQSTPFIYYRFLLLAYAKTKQ